MLFIPYAQFSMPTNLSEAEVTQKIGIIMEDADKNDLWGNSTKPYQGKILADRIKMSRKIWYRNYYLPVIIIRVLGFGSQSKIKIEMRLDLFILCIVTTILLVTGILSVIMTINQVQQKSISGEKNIPIIIFAFQYVVVLIGFHIERRKAEKDLKKLFGL